MAPKPAFYRCGNCRLFPGRGRTCRYNTCTGGGWIGVREESYACRNFKRGRRV